ncbi:hypothetical protein WR25_00882 [Diploscapter pachys]|uniref:Uncharacterized protein n=1 Tax=Diploscapter pachys TaxID=2018661 RepID=A0A2A2KVU9_9BILA|nr:hypothetical protein WR25_00882 [Diploscapter pachys]
MLRPVVVFSSPAGGNIESAVASAVSAGVSSLAATVSVSLPAVAATSGISGRQPHLVGLNPLWTLQAQQQLAQPSTSREYLLNDLLTSRQLLTSVGFPSIPSSSSPSVLLNSVLTVQSHQQQQHQQLSRLSSSAPNMCSLSSTLGQIDSESQQQTPCTSTSNGSPSFIKVNSMSLYFVCAHFHVATNLFIGEKDEKRVAGHVNRGFKSTIQGPMIMQISSI